MSERLSEAITWKPLPEPEKPKEDGFTIKYEISPSLRNDPSINFEQLKNRVEEYFDEAYKYLYSFLPPDVPIDRQWHVKLTPGKTHRALGIELHLSVHFISLDPSASAHRIDLEKSLIMHEMLHSLREAEDFSMLIEMIYILEHGHMQRIKDIQTLYEQGKLGKHYEEGLQQIAIWLGLETPEQLFESIESIGVLHLKEVFREKLQDYTSTF